MELSNGATITKFIAKNNLLAMRARQAKKWHWEISSMGRKTSWWKFCFLCVMISELTVAELRICDSFILQLDWCCDGTVKAVLPVSLTSTGKLKTSNPLIDKQKNRIMTIKALESEEESWWSLLRAKLSACTMLTIVELRLWNSSQNQFEAELC